MTEKKEGVMSKTYSVLVENEPGVLSRIAGLFSARGYNILSLAVGETLDPTMSRMTIVVEGTSKVLEQINKQLNKLVPVISVLDIPEKELLSRELVLLKIENTPLAKETIERYQKDFDLSVLSQTAKYVVVQAVGPGGPMEQALKKLSALNIVEICRTGQIAVAKERTFGFFGKQAS